MRLVFIYGPPAIGKLTVARQLAAATGFKLFHNHASIDLVEPIFAFGSTSFRKLVYKIRLDIIEEAARHNISGLIFTFVYAHPVDKPFVDEVSQIVEGHGGEVCFVQLSGDLSTLEKRLQFESRRIYGKIVTLEALHEVIGQHDLFSPIAEKQSLTIDTTYMCAHDVVRRILDHYPTFTSMRPPHLDFRKNTALAGFRLD